MAIRSLSLPQIAKILSAYVAIEDARLSGDDTQRAQSVELSARRPETLRGVVQHDNSVSVKSRPETCLTQTVLTARARHWRDTRTPLGQADPITRNVVANTWHHTDGQATFIARAPRRLLLSRFATVR